MIKDFRPDTYPPLTIVIDEMAEMSEETWERLRKRIYRMRTSRCDESACKAEIIFLKNPKTDKFVPVDVDSLSEEDQELLDRGEEIAYDSSTGHVSHFKTCSNPRRFSKK